MFCADCPAERQFHFWGWELRQKKGGDILQIVASFKSLLGNVERRSLLFASLYSEHRLFAPSTTAISISPSHSRHFSASEPEVPTPNNVLQQLNTSIHPSSSGPSRGPWTVPS